MAIGQLENPAGEKVDEFAQLRSSMETSYRHLRQFRDNRLTYIGEYVGGHYGDSRTGLHGGHGAGHLGHRGASGIGGSNQTPNNLIYKYVSIMKRELTPGTPRAKVDTFVADLRSEAAGLEEALNIRLEDMRLIDQLKQMVVESMFGMGIIKVGLNHSETVEVGGWEHDTMEPFAEVIEFEDFVWDTSAKRWEQINFCGNRYQMTVQDLEESGMFDEDAIQEFKDGQEESRFSEDRFADGELHAIEFTTGNSVGDDNFKEIVVLWDVWLPRENSIITMMDKTNIVLREEEWFGPEGGPYHRLGFDVVPGNIMPVCPIANLFDLHRMNNAVMSKVANQAINAKKILGISAGGKEDSERINNAADGDTIKLNNPENAKEFEIRGVQAGGGQFVALTGAMFNENAGNLNVSAGLGSEADTFGQEKLLAANASKQVVDMGDEVTRVVGDIVKSIAFYILTDPLARIPIRKKIPGVPGVEVLTTFDGQEVQGEFNEYTISLFPYSLEERSPSGDVAAVLQIIQQVYLPLLADAQAQGISLDVATLFTEIGDSLNLPVLSRVLVSSEGQLTDRGGSQEPRQAANTTRTQIRQNVSADEGNEVQDLSNALTEQQ